MSNYQLQLAAAYSQAATGIATAARLGGTAYIDERDGLPFQVLLTTSPDSLQALDDADVGLFLVCRRVIKPGDAASIGLFPMVHRPDRSHAECDAHWRDNHGPLALHHHQAMTQYHQLNVLHRFRGEDFHGFALCGFANPTDLRERFFSHPDSVAVIREDVMKFADPSASPRRLVATPQTFNPD